jgi:ubiquinone/menaquinone biosynthesis C-methylase UbiE
MKGNRTPRAVEKSDISSPPVVEPAAALRTTLAGDTIHETWERSFRSDASERFYEKAFDWIVAHAGIAAGGNVLDVGCGIGQHSARLARRGFTVEAVDISAGRVAAARQNLERQGLATKVRVMQGDAVAGLPYADGSFDGVLCWGVLTHIPEIEKAMAELIRVTHPGGRIILSETSSNSVDGWTSRSATLLRRDRGRKVLRSSYGLEYWTDTEAGKLFIRHSSARALRRYFEKNGCRRRGFAPGQFTEAYWRFTKPGVLRLIHGWNDFWFDRVRLPMLASANLMVFERDSEAAIQEPATDMARKRN